MRDTNYLGKASNVFKEKVRKEHDVNDSFHFKSQILRLIIMLLLKKEETILPQSSSKSDEQNLGRKSWGLVFWCLIDWNL